MKINAEMITHLKGHFENNKVCDALIKKWKTDFTKKKKNQYKYSTKRKTFSSIIQAQSSRINPTDMKTLTEKEMMLGLKKRKKKRHQTEAIM